MIQIQLKNGTFYNTKALKFVILSNIEHIDFWATDEKGSHTRIEVAVSKIEGVSINITEIAAKVAESIKDILADLSTSLDSFKDWHLKENEALADVLDRIKKLQEEKNGKTVEPNS